MRRILLVSAALVGLVVPAVALAARGAVGDGTLAVRGASGDTLLQPVVGLGINGAVVGHIATGRLVILPSTTGPDPIVTGADHTLDRTDGSTVYSGTDISFKAVGGYYRLRVSGFGIDVNAVGQGKAWLEGSPTDTPGDGRYSTNGAAWASMPDTLTQVSIGS
jgi:hypothetical protein